MANVLINGKEYDWSSVEIGIDDAPQILKDHIVAIDYEDKENIKARYGRGNTPIGWTKGKWEGSGKITLTRTGFNILMEWVRSQGKQRVSQIPPFPITISYLDDEFNVAVTDKLPSVKMDNPKTKAAEGDEKVDVEITLVLLQPIEWSAKA